MTFLGNVQAKELIVVLELRPSPWRETGKDNNELCAFTVEAIARTCENNAWDDFAGNCDASFRCTHRAAAYWQLEDHLFSRLVYLELFLQLGSDKVKVGQCAVSVGRRLKVFSDTIQLLPTYRALWPECMAAVLARLGPGEYRYGSEWSLEPSKVEAFRAVRGVKVREARMIDLQAVAFQSYESWEQYYRSVSTNARRNVQKAERTYSDLSIRERAGPQVFRDLVQFEVSRHRLFRQKNVPSSRTSLVLRSGFRLLATRDFSFSTTLISADATLARYMGIELGGNHFFLEAAAEASRSGAASYLLRAMIKRAYLRSNGKGTFVFGPDDHRQQGNPAWEGLVRSREQWKATPHATSVVAFSYEV